MMVPTRREGESPLARLDTPGIYQKKVAKKVAKIENELRFSHGNCEPQ